MRHNRYHRPIYQHMQRTCGSKRAYLTEQEAARGRHGHQVRVYKCPYCPNWHRTTQR